jgi:hypothetical protein
MSRNGQPEVMFNAHHRPYVRTVSRAIGRRAKWVIDVPAIGEKCSKGRLDSPDSL